MTDEYIKRIDALKATCENCTEHYVCNGKCDDTDRLRNIPAADVEPKREIVPWKVAGTFDDFHQCTKCGNMWPIFSTVEWAYCPVCGCRKFPESLKPWTNNPWCDAVGKALELEPPKEDDDAKVC